MNPIRLLTSALTIALLCVSVWSAESAILPDDRMGQWPGNVGVKGGIPAWTNVFTNFTSSATAAQINAALAACPASNVVYLSAGTYNLDSQLVITRGDVVLRGAGMTNTVLVFTGNHYGSIFCNGRNVGKANEGHVDALVNWTNGYTQGGSNLVVNTASNIVVGDIVVLDQLNDNLHVNAYGYEGLNTGSRDSGTRSQQQFVEVMAVDGNTLTVWPPVMMPNYTNTLTPQIWKPSSAWNGWIQRVGFESFTVDGTATANWDAYAANFFLFGVVDCWIKNVKSLNPKVSHVNPFGAFRCEVRHCYFYGTQAAQSMSYGIVPVATGSSLFEDNIFEKCAGAMIEASCSQGNVWAYNYVTNAYYTSGDYILMAGQVHHDAHTSMILWEGNYGPKFNADFAHGSGGYGTLFRNRLTGYAEWTYPDGPSSKYLTAIALDITNHYFSAIGNLLGTSGVHTNYQWLSTDDAIKFYCFDGNAAIYMLGLVNGGYAGVWNPDPLVASTFYRHGNYDTASNSIVWDPDNADRTLPNSLLYTSKPAFFGDLTTWPPFNPTNTTAAALSPTNIPAGYRFVYGLTYGYDPDETPAPAPPADPPATPGQTYPGIIGNLHVIQLQCTP